jgi:hypothetical protein
MTNSPQHPAENDREDRQIRALLITASALAIGFVLVSLTVVAVMISYNFNILEWME